MDRDLNLWPANFTFRKRLYIQRPPLHFSFSIWVREEAESGEFVIFIE